MGTFSKSVSGLLVVTALMLCGAAVAWWLGVDPQTPGDAVGRVDAMLTPWRYVIQALRLLCWIVLWYGWHAIPWNSKSRFAEKRNLVVGGLLALELAILISRLGV